MRRSIEMPPDDPSVKQWLSDRGGILAVQGHIYYREGERQRDPKMKRAGLAMQVSGLCFQNLPGKKV